MRRLDAGAGRLPDFLVIGAPRAGTTSMSEYLRAHPEVFVSEPKEINYFDRREPTPGSLTWYRRHFADATPHQRAGEATPHYLASSEAHARMAAIVPDARLVALVRDPVDRAYSHYWWRRTWAAEVRDFGSAVADELDGNVLPGAEYLRDGMYHTHLRRLCEHVPRQNLLVVVFDDLIADPQSVFTDVCRHIGVRPHVPDNVGRRINTTVELRWPRLWRAMRPVRRKQGRRYAWARFVDSKNALDLRPPPLDAEVRRRLVDHFTGPNEELAAWLGRALPWAGGADVRPDPPI